MYNDTHSDVLLALYARISAFLSALGVALCFEAEGGAAADGGLCAVFRAEDSFYKTAEYVNGTEVRRGAFSVSFRAGDRDTAARRAAEQLSLRLLSMIRTEKDSLTFEDGGILLYGVTPDSAPTRVRLIPGGAVWEVRFHYNMILRSVDDAPAGGNERSGNPA